MARRNSQRKGNNRNKGGKHFNNNKPRNNRNRIKNEIERSEEEREANTGSNDVSWMVLDQSMLAGISNYNFITPLGRMIDSYSDSVPSASGLHNKASAIPGVCRYDYIPTPGISTRLSS